MNDFAGQEEPLFNDLIEGARLPSPQTPFHYTFELLDFWDHLSRGESETTCQVREALKKDFEELGISA